VNKGLAMPPPFANLLRSPRRSPRCGCGRTSVQVCKVRVFGTASNLVLDEQLGDASAYRASRQAARRAAAATVSVCAVGKPEGGGGGGIAARCWSGRCPPAGNLESPSAAESAGPAPARAWAPDVPEQSAVRVRHCLSISSLLPGHCTASGLMLPHAAHSPPPGELGRASLTGR
jgi:hypothetical protein